MWNACNLKPSYKFIHSDDGIISMSQHQSKKNKKCVRDGRMYSHQKRITSNIFVARIRCGMRRLAGLASAPHTPRTLIQTMRTTTIPQWILHYYTFLWAIMSRICCLCDNIHHENLKLGLRSCQRNYCGGVFLWCEKCNLHILQLSIASWTDHTPSKYVAEIALYANIHDKNLVMAEDFQSLN